MFGRNQRGVDDLASIDDVRGPAERRLQAVSYETTAAVASRESDPALSGAKAVFEEGRYAEAEKAYKTILGRYRPDSVRRAFGTSRTLTGKKTADDRAIEEYGSPIEQECLFMIAECQFRQQKFAKAEESYGRLLQRYPATRYLDTVSNRTYTIARHWLGFPPPQVVAGPDQNSNDIQQVVFSDVKQSSDPAVAPEPAGWLNLSDPSKPRFDTTGRALNALKSIWLNDPTGPLADDSLILTANHYYRKGDPVEAARFYELLREQYPDSPHLKNAYLLESHVKLVSYAGAKYDDTSLEEAAKLKQASLQIFPDLDVDQKQQLSRELTQIQDAMVAREWTMVELYRQKNRPAAIRLHCNSIINQYPDSRYADRARAMLQMLAEEERNGGRSIWPFGRRDVPALQPTANEQTASASIDLTPPKTSSPQLNQLADSSAQPSSKFDTQPLRTAENSTPSRGDNFARTPPAETPQSGKAIVQVGATDNGENPFSGIMQALGETTTAEKPAITNAAYEEAATPSRVVPASNWAPSNDSQKFTPPQQ